MSIKSLPFICSFFVASLAFGQQKGYYRTPALHGNTVVFTAEGDLWKYDTGTGQSTRLTTNTGVEQNPAISPDGKKVAFLGEYEGLSEVYVMDINGGVPQRLTYDLGAGMNISGW